MPGTPHSDDVRQRLREALLRREAPPRIAGTAADRSRLPLTPGQLRLWTAHQVVPSPGVFNRPLALRLRGEVDATAVQRALDAVVTRHEILRTSFHRDGGAVHQSAHAGARADLEVVPPGPELRQAFRERLSLPFALDAAPLLRATLFEEGRGAVLLLVFHHIVFDGRSEELFVDDLAAALEGIPLPPLPLQYGDLASSDAPSSVRDEDLDYWRTTLAGAPPLVTLPADHPRAPVQRGRGATRRFVVDAASTSALKSFASAAGLTNFSVLLAAFSALVSRMARTRDVVVGVPVAGRHGDAPQRLIGFFVNTLPLRLSVAPDESFAALCARSGRTVAEALTRSAVPFESILDTVRPARSASHAPLFQLSIQLRPRAAARRTATGISIERMEVDSITAKVDLALDLHESDGALRGEIEYDTDLYDEATVDALAGRFLRLLRGGLAAPGSPVAELPLLDGEERRWILREWNEPLTPECWSTPVADLFERRAAETPGAVAVIEEERATTYLELEAWSRAIALALRHAGVVEGDVVAVHAGRSAAYVAALVAIVRCGAVYLPIDVRLPARRIEQLLADSGARAVVARETPPPGTSLPLVDVAVSPASEPLPPRRGIDAESPLCLLYTSGSSGRPKGVLLPQRAITRLCFGTWYTRQGPGRSFAQLSSVSFDVSSEEIWAPLVNGGATAIVPDETLLEARAFGRFLKRHGVTMAALPTALFRHHLARAPEIFAGLDPLIVGGEALDRQSALTLLRASAPPRRFTNGYGPTEAGVAALGIDLSEEAVREGVPIGRPLNNSRVYLVDEGCRLVPPGAVGEIALGGPAVALGYHDRAELTAERFVPDPFEGSGLMYLTGDLGILRRDGNVDFLGRLDDQVKVRGFRIEPEEVKAAINRAPSVRDSFVAALGEGSMRRLVAWVAAPPAFDARDLRESLARELPAYMVPSVILRVDELPMTSNGKVDRERLPEPAAEQASHEGENELESMIAAVWSATGGVTPHDYAASFFDAGGTSLSAIAMLEQIEVRSGIRVAPAEFFAAPTIEGLAMRLRAGGGAGSGSPLVRLRAGTGATPLVLLPGGDGTQPHLLGFSQLAQKVDPSVPLLGLTWSGSEAESLAQLADRWAAAVAAETDAPELALAGDCVGGIVAHELARRLRARGRRVAFVALFDSRLPAPSELVDAATNRGHVKHLSRSEKVRRLFGRIAFHHERSRALGPAERLRYYAGRVIRSAGWLPFLLKRGESSERAASRSPFAAGRYGELALSHAVEPARVPLLLFVSSRSAARASALGWRNVEEDATVVELDGPHRVYLNEAADVAAREIERRLGIGG